MTTLRPECGSAKGSPCPTEATAYYLIRESVAKRRSLAAGALHKNGLSCAVGSFFDDHPNYALPTSVIDEVAAVNDSYKSLSAHERWKKVNSWLRWKVRVLAGAAKNARGTRVSTRAGQKAAAIYSWMCQWRGPRGRLLGEREGEDHD